MRYITELVFPHRLSGESCALVRYHNNCVLLLFKLVFWTLTPICFTLICCCSGYDAPVHMGIGNAGVVPLDVVGNETNTPPWVAYQASEYGYTTLRYNLRELEIAYYNNQSVVHYTTTIKRDYPRVSLSKKY